MVHETGEKNMKELIPLIYEYAHINLAALF